MDGQVAEHHVSRGGCVAVHPVPALWARPFFLTMRDNSNLGIRMTLKVSTSHAMRLYCMLLTRLTEGRAPLGEEAGR